MKSYDEIRLKNSQRYVRLQRYVRFFVRQNQFETEDRK